jgi:DnaJ-class molecular chaperone
MIPNNACAPCAECDGRGFLAHGNMPDRTFRKCPVCDGIGQRYITPAPEPPPSKPKPAPDPMTF